MNIEKVKKLCKDERCIIKTRVIKDGEQVASAVGTGTAQYFLGDGFPELSAGEFADVFGVPEEKRGEYYLANRDTESAVFCDSWQSGEKVVFEMPVRFLWERVWSVFKTERGEKYFVPTDCLKPFEKDELDVRYSVCNIDGVEYMRVFCGFFLIAVIIIESYPEEISRIKGQIEEIAKGKILKEEMI